MIDFQNDLLELLRRWVLPEDFHYSAELAGGKLLDEEATYVMKRWVYNKISRAFVARSSRFWFLLSDSTVFTVFKCFQPF